jgi:hypothetical protein
MVQYRNKIPLGDLVPNKLSQGDFAWVELAGFLPDGRMLRDQFVRIDDVDAITTWRDKFSNTDIFTSICRHEKPDCLSDFVAPLFFDILLPYALYGLACFLAMLLGLLFRNPKRKDLILRWFKKCRSDLNDRMKR